MKIAIIGDTHWGVRNNNPVFYDYFKKSLDEILFPMLKEKKPDLIVHLGDLYDRRSNTNTYANYRLKTDFLEPLNTLNIPVVIIAGNHDCYYKDTNHVNALTEFVDGKYKNITIYTEAKEVGPILFVPWINSSNRERTFDLIAKTKAQFCFGHLELNGIKMSRYTVAKHGDDPVNFKHIPFVFSGHYHTASENGNIKYLGSPFQYTWEDFGDIKSFYLFDTKTKEIECFPNTNELFVLYHYDETYDDPKTFDFSIFKEKYVKIDPVNKTDEHKFDTFIKNLEMANPVKLDIIPKDQDAFVPLEEVDDNIKVEDTLVFFYRSIPSDNPLAEKLKTKINEIYIEAQQITIQ